MKEDRKKALKLLSSYDPLSKEIHYLLEERSNLVSHLFLKKTRDGSPLDLEFAQKSLSQEIKQLEQRICESIGQNIQSRLLIEELICSVQPVEARPILRCRYIERIPMEYIPPRVHFCLRHCWNLHNAAVDNISLLIN